MVPARRRWISASTSRTWCCRPVPADSAGSTSARRLRRHPCAGRVLAAAARVHAKAPRPAQRPRPTSSSAAARSTPWTPRALGHRRRQCAAGASPTSARQPPGRHWSAPEPRCWISPAGWCCPASRTDHVHLLGRRGRAGRMHAVQAPSAAGDRRFDRGLRRGPARRHRGCGVSAGSSPPFPGRTPARRCSTSLVPDRPALIDAADGHSAWANSRALALAGITRIDARIPWTGGSSGILAPASRAGRCGKSAMALVSDLLPERTEAELAAGLERAQRLANEAGITSVLEAMGARELPPHLCRSRPDGTADRSHRGGRGRRARLHRSRGRGRAAGRLARAIRDPPGPAHRGETVPGRRHRVGHRRAALALPRPTRGRRQADLSPADARQPGRRARPRGLASPRPRDRRPRHPDDARRLRARRATPTAHATRGTPSPISSSSIPPTSRDSADSAWSPTSSPIWANGDEYLTRLAEPALGRGAIAMAVSHRQRGAHRGNGGSGGSDWSVSSLAPLDGIEVAITRRLPGER